MPPKKEVTVISGTAQAQQDAASDGIESYELPKSLVTRLARSALPENAKMQKEMVLALSKGSTVFVNYLAATAHDIASQKQHKSVSASDVLKALEQLDMGDMVPKLQQDLQAYRANQKPTTKKGAAKDKGDSASTSKGKQKADPLATDSAGNGKGKEKATITIPSRASASAPNPKTLTILEPETQPDEEVDEEDEVIGGEDEEMMDPDEDVEDIEDEPEEEDLEDEGDEAADAVALEEDELQRDAQGVEEPNNDMDEDD